MNWKKPLSKIHLSIVILSLVLAAGFIVIGVPIHLYDQHVIKKGQECAKHTMVNQVLTQIGSEPDFYYESPPEFDPDKFLASKKPKFDPEKPYEVVEPPYKNKGKKIPRPKGFVTDHELLTLDRFKKSDANFYNFEVPECDGFGSWDRYNKEYEFISNKVIIDNDPQPLGMFYVSLFFIGLAVFLVLLKKWLTWIFRD